MKKADFEGSPSGRLLEEVAGTSNPRYFAHGIRDIIDQRPSGRQA